MKDFEIEGKKETNTIKASQTKELEPEQITPSNEPSNDMDSE